MLVWMMFSTKLLKKPFLVGMDQIGFSAICKVFQIGCTGVPNGWVYGIGLNEHLSYDYLQCSYPIVPEHAKM